jgi:hypothetical protein
MSGTQLKKRPQSLLGSPRNYAKPHPSLKRKEQTLLLLYSAPDTAVPVEDLANWIEYDRVSHYRRDVLVPLHKARLIEFDRETETAHLSPTGAKNVEEDILPKIGVGQA